MSSRSLRRSGRKLGVAVIAAALGLSGLALGATPAQALPGFDLTRLEGPTRIETAVEISEATFPASDTALIARADKFPDALAGNYLAGIETAPILLSHTDEIPQATLDELDRLGATNVVLLGGTEALSADVEAAFAAEGYTVTREAGVDRYETAADIATQDGVTPGTTDAGATALLATGENFPDALTGGPLAYAEQFPLLLTPSAELGEDAAGALEALAIDHVLILGGTAAVSGTVEAELTAMGMTSQRLDGLTRYDTATDIAEFALTLGFTDAHINVATGTNFPDALTGGPHGGEELTPIILANEGNTVEACAYLEAHSDSLVDGHIYGGVLAGFPNAPLSAAVEATLEECGQGTGNQAFDVSPSEAGTFETGDEVDHTVTGITSETVDIALFDCADVSVAEDGTVTFVDANADGEADVTPTTATITEVNGVSGAFGSHVNDAIVTDGGVTFTVTSTATEECVIAVVFNDADDDDALDVDADGLPTEEFGVGGEMTFSTITALDADPEFEVNPFGTEHTVTASLVDANGDTVAVDGDTVRFTLYLEDNTNDTIEEATDGTGEYVGPCGGTAVEIENVTVADGTAAFTFTQADPNAGAESNDYEFCVEADAVDRTLAGAEIDYVAKVFSDDAAQAASVTLTPAQDSNAVGTQHTVTATVTDQFGQPLDETVTFEVYRESNDVLGAEDPTLTTTAATGADGQASFSYTGPATSDSDVIVACVDDAADGCDVTVDFTAGEGTVTDADAAELDASAAKFWAAAAADGQDATTDEVVGFDVEADQVDVNDGTQILRYLYDTGDQFQILGAPVSYDDFEDALSAGDVISIDYNQPGVSLFNITTDNP